MSEKMHEIRGKQVSEDTIVEALQKHCGFEEEEKKYVFKGGDVAIGHGGIRIIAQPPKESNLCAFDTNGGWQTIRGQAGFDAGGYKKIGVLADFIKKDC